MTKRRLMKIALEEAKKSKPGLEKLEEHLKGMPALIFTEDNPFGLYKTVKKSKSPAPAKAGQEAPKDIIIPAGPTNFSPGPVIGELGALGVKSGVANGKIAIQADTVVAKAGDTISAELAGMLTRLNIQPMELGLDITAVYEDGTIYTRSVLDIDEDKFMADMQRAATWAFNLAIETAYPTKETAETLVTKGFRNAKAVALESAFPAEGMMDELLAKGSRQAASLKKEAKIE
jgi:large subunit ribosomal protein L10